MYYHTPNIKIQNKDQSIIVFYIRINILNYYIKTKTNNFISIHEQNQRETRLTKKAIK